MAKRGDYARQAAVDTIIKAFSDKGTYFCTRDKKIYVFSRDGEDLGSEIIQFAISLTMPKNPIMDPGDSQANTPKKVDNAFDTIPPQSKVELSAEDSAKIDELMKKLKSEGFME